MNEDNKHPFSPQDIKERINDTIISSNILLNTPSLSILPISKLSTIDSTIHKIENNEEKLNIPSIPSIHISSKGTNHSKKETTNNNNNNNNELSNIEKNEQINLNHSIQTTPMIQEINELSTLPTNLLLTTNKVRHGSTSSTGTICPNLTNISNSTVTGQYKSNNNTIVLPNRRLSNPKVRRHSNEMSSSIADELLKELNGQISDQQQKLYSMLRTKHVLSYRSFYREILDIIVIIAKIYLALIFPLRLGFAYLPGNSRSSSYRTTNNFWFLLEFFFDLLFLFEIILNFITTYKEESSQLEINDIKKISKNYIKNWFLFDIITSIPTTIYYHLNDEYVADNDDVILINLGNYMYIDIIRVFKILHIRSIGTFQIFQKWYIFFSKKINPVTFNMLKLLFFFFYSQHLIACAYWKVSRFEKFQTKWTPDPIYSKLSGRNNGNKMFQQYVKAIYWAVIVTKANDVSPETTLEKSFTIFMFLFGLLIDASIIATAAGLLANLDLRASENNSHIDKIYQFWRTRRITTDIQYAVEDYYDYSWETNKGLDIINNQCIKNLFTDLPYNVQIMLRMALKRHFITKVPIFKAFSTIGLTAVIYSLQSIVVLQKEKIISEEEIGNEFFFIDRGSVNVYIMKGDMLIPLGTLSEGSFFGEVALLRSDTNYQRTANVRAISICELEVMKKKDFDEIIMKFAVFRKIVHKIAATRMQTTNNVQKMKKMKQGGSFAIHTSSPLISSKDHLHMFSKIIQGVQSIRDTDKSMNAFSFIRKMYRKLTGEEKNGLRILQQIGGKTYDRIIRESFFDDLTKKNVNLITESKDIAGMKLKLDQDTMLEYMRYEHK